MIVLDSAARLACVALDTLADKIERLRPAPLPKKWGFVGLGSDCVPAGATVVLNAEPQIPFRPTGIIVTPPASAFVFDGLQIGRLTLMVSSGPVSCYMFSMRSRGIPISAPLLPAGCTILAHVKNISKRDRPFHAVILGEDLMPQMIR